MLRLSIEANGLVETESINKLLANVRVCQVYQSLSEKVLAL
jgi:hypothetical protein